MSGLIWGGLIKGVGDAAATYGSNLVKYDEAKELLKQRELERRETMRETQGYIDARAEADRLARGERSAGRAGSGGRDGDAGDWRVPGTLAHTDAALRSNTPEALLPKVLEAERTGDRSYLDEVAEGRGPMPDGSAMPESRVRPEGADRWHEARVAVLRKISQEYAVGKDMKPIAEARATEQKTGMINQAVENPQQAPVLAQGMAVGDGNGAFGKGQVNQFTGAPDAIGKSAVTENNASAGRASAAAKRDMAEIEKIQADIKAGPTEKAQSADRLTTIVNSQIGVLKELAENRPGPTAKPEVRAAYDEAVSTAKAVRDKANALLNSNLDARGAPPAKPTADASGTVKPAAPSSLPAPATKAERDKLPAGTRYRAPDGTVKIKG
jgi:hypothetical protein